MIRHALLALGTGLLLASSATAGEVQVVLEPSKDNTIFNDSVGFSSNGSGDQFIVGRTGPTAPNPKRRALLAFDVAGNLPPGATITSVSLRLNMRISGGTASNVRLHRLMSDWGEAGSVSPGGKGSAPDIGDATWTHTFYPNQTWAKAGGNFASTASATLLVDQLGYHTWTSAQLAADVQDMLDAPSGDFGWLLRDPENVQYTAKLFSSREWPLPAERPLLTITYLPPAPVSYCTAGDSANGCTAQMSTSGTPSESAASGFQLLASGVEGQKDGLFFFGANGRQANPWGNGTSFQCVVPPVSRAGLMSGAGTPGQCNGTFVRDLNARWTAKPGQNPGAGAIVQAQLWYRDPQNTSNQTTSLSDAIEFVVCP